MVRVAAVGEGCYSGIWGGVPFHEFRPLVNSHGGLRKRETHLITPTAGVSVAAV